MANTHRRRNFLVRVKTENDWLTEEGEIKEAAVGHFWNLLTTSNDWRPGVDGFPFKQLGERMLVTWKSSFLRRRCIQLEIFSEDKSLGSDGFTMAC